MIINTLRVEGASPEFIIKHSFLQFQSSRKLPKLREGSLLFYVSFTSPLHSVSTSIFFLPHLSNYDQISQLCRRPSQE